MLRIIALKKQTLMNKVSFRLTFAEALEIGVKNAPSIIGCVVLWLLTICHNTL